MLTPNLPKIYPANTPFPQLPIQVSLNRKLLVRFGLAYSATPTPMDRKRRLVMIFPHSFKTFLTNQGYSM